MSGFDFNNKIALVTGGASGIGLATARTFAAAGASVVIADRQQQLGEAAVAELKAGGHEALYVDVDVTDPTSVQTMVDACMARFGRLDCAVNSAGISGGRRLATETDLELWKQVIDVNLNGVFYCMRSELSVMVKQGAGAIVNLASILGSVGLGGAAAYTASKHAVVGLTKAAAIDHAKDHVRVNSVGPGFIDTPLITRVTDDPAMKAHITSLHPIGRLGQPQEIANLIVFLCSDEASFMTGGYYVADGGYTAQ